MICNVCGVLPRESVMLSLERVPVCVKTCWLISCIVLRFPAKPLMSPLISLIQLIFLFFPYCLTLSFSSFFNFLLLLFLRKVSLLLFLALSHKYSIYTRTYNSVPHYRHRYRRVYKETYKLLLWHHIVSDTDKTFTEKVTGRICHSATRDSSTMQEKCGRKNNAG